MKYQVENNASLAASKSARLLQWSDDKEIAFYRTWFFFTIIVAIYTTSFFLECCFCRNSNKKLIIATVKEGTILVLMAIEACLCAFEYMQESDGPGYKIYSAIIMTPALLGLYWQ